MNKSDFIGIIGIVVGTLGTIVTIVGIVVTLNQQPAININNINGNINITYKIATSEN